MKLRVFESPTLSISFVLPSSIEGILFSKFLFKTSQSLLLRSCIIYSFIDAFRSKGVFSSRRSDFYLDRRLLGVVVCKRSSVYRFSTSPFISKGVCVHMCIYIYTRIVGETIELSKRLSATFSRAYSRSICRPMWSTRRLIDRNRPNSASTSACTRYSGQL